MEQPVNKFERVQIAPPEPPSGEEGERWPGEMTLAELHGSLVVLRGVADEDGAVEERYAAARGVKYPSALVPRATAPQVGSQQVLRQQPRRLLLGSENSRGTLSMMPEWLHSLFGRRSSAADAAAVGGRLDQQHHNNDHTLDAQQQQQQHWQTPEEAGRRQQRRPGVRGLVHRAEYMVHAGLHRLGLRKSSAIRPGSLPASVWGVGPGAAARAMGWHRSRGLLAVALPNNSICLYDLVLGGWEALSMHHRLQTDVAALEWAPRGPRLAVACRSGVCVWHVVAEESSRLPSAAAVAGAARSNGSSSNSNDVWQSGYGYQSAFLQHLALPGHAPVVTVAWSPDARYLASGSPNDPGCVLWEVASGAASPLLRAGGTTLLRWSPAGGDYLFQATAGGVFRVWETQSWTHQAWSNVAGTSQTACWSPDGSALAIAELGQSTFHVLSFPHRAPQIAGQWLQSESVAAYTAKLPNGRSVRAGGKIGAMDWDATGARFAVSFLPSVDVSQGANGSGSSSNNHGPRAADVVDDDDDAHAATVAAAGDDEGDGIGSRRHGQQQQEHVAGPAPPRRDGSELVALFAVSDSLEFNPLGFLRGPPEGGSAVVAFRPTFDRGALLSACWQNGKLSFYPLYFGPQASGWT